MMQWFAASVFSRCAQTTPLLEQQEMLFPSFSVLLLLFSQKGGGVIFTKAIAPPQTLSLSSLQTAMAWQRECGNNTSCSDKGVVLASGGGGMTRTMAASPKLVFLARLPKHKFKRLGHSRRLKNWIMMMAQPKGVTTIPIRSHRLAWIPSERRWMINRL